MVQWLELNDSTAGGPGSIPGWGTKIPHALQPKKKKKKDHEKNQLSPPSKKRINAVSN